MKVLVTGSNGMLGRALLDTLHAGKIYGMGRLAEALNRKNEGFEYVSCDITDRGAVFEAVNRIKPGVVVHAAAFTQVDDCEREREKAMAVNFTGTVNMADAARETSAFLIFVSTDYVFDGRKNTPYLEEDKVAPLSVYGASKLEAEKYLLAMNSGNLIVRTSWVYGPGGKNFVETILRLADERPSLEVVDDQAGRPTYTYDLASAIAWLCGHVSADNAGRPGVFPRILHVANQGTATWFDFAREIIARAGKKTEVKPVSSERLARPARRPMNSVLDTSKYDCLTKRPLREWKEALSEYLALRRREE